METDTLARTTVTAKVENARELFFADQGIIQPGEVHRLEVTDALVDTGSIFLAMPLRFIEQLGFQKPITT